MFIRVLLLLLLFPLFLRTDSLASSRCGYHSGPVQGVRVTGEQFVVVSYDITSSKRRLKVARLLLDYGGERVQYSVFELYITERHLERLRARLQKLVDTEEDSVRFYRLCAACRPKVEYVGRATPIEAPGLRII